MTKNKPHIAFVTNFNSNVEDYSLELQVAEYMGLNAWVSHAYYEYREAQYYPGIMGFYVDRKKGGDLTKFWELVRNLKNDK